MTRWWRAMAALACLIASGCSAGGGAATVASGVGQVGDCYPATSTQPVDCSLAHVAETVFVSQSALARGTSALAPCRTAQAQFLGQDFNTRFDVQLWVASDQSWHRCDVSLRTSTQSGSGYQTLTGSLKGVLERGVSVPLQACLAEPYDAASDQTYVSCAEPHVAQQLVAAPAIGTLKEPFPADVAGRAAKACNATASAADMLGRHRSVEAFYPNTADTWASGERTADCWVTADEGTLPALSP